MVKVGAIERAQGRPLLHDVPSIGPDLAIAVAQESRTGVRSSRSPAVIVGVVVPPKPWRTTVTPTVGECRVDRRSPGTNSSGQEAALGLYFRILRSLPYGEYRWRKLTTKAGSYREDNMTLQALKPAKALNPRNADEARAFVKQVEQLFMPWNVDAIVDGFTDDCVVKFGSLAPFRGKDQLRQFFLARSTRQKDYRLTKEFRALTNELIANYWEGSWQDAETGMRMVGRGVETWLMRDGKIAVWEAAFNVSQADRPGRVADILN